MESIPCYRLHRQHNAKSWKSQHVKQESPLFCAF
nr:MAG TPA: hypothetical protein [Caudoviricetes sp.]